MAGEEDLAADALAGRHPVAQPALRRLVAGGRHAAVLGVAEVDAGHVAADGHVGLAREPLERLVARQAGVEHGGAAGQRRVAVGA